MPAGVHGEDLLDAPPGHLLQVEPVVPPELAVGQLHQIGGQLPGGAVLQSLALRDILPILKALGLLHRHRSGAAVQLLRGQGLDQALVHPQGGQVLGGGLLLGGKLR